MIIIDVIVFVIVTITLQNMYPGQGLLKSKVVIYVLLFTQHHETSKEAIFIKSDLYNVCLSTSYCGCSVGISVHYPHLLPFCVLLF